jgi:hypothetical protein
MVREMRMHNGAHVARGVEAAMSTVEEGVEPIVPHTTACWDAMCACEGEYLSQTGLRAKESLQGRTQRRSQNARTRWHMKGKLRKDDRTANVGLGGDAGCIV